ncbi:COX assembly mitochondrial protein homolog isoform X2 [Equus asinus]|uniref:COX assembly mitochondrial protein homolog isoform X2 n=1 Tax=Equus asinus TaxID=9793 RepID=UPI0038F638BA
MKFFSFGFGTLTGIFVWTDFTKCCKDSGVLMVVKCRKENSALKECLIAHYNDPAFYEECKMEYLKEREEFRKTGIPTKKRLQKLPTSM